MEFIFDNPEDTFALTVGNADNVPVFRVLSYYLKDL